MLTFRPGGVMGLAERRERERQERRNQIMDAAKEAFLAKGFTGATMEEIAERAELSPAALYNYFKSKYDLYASLNLKMLERLNQEVEQLKDRDDLDPLEKIRSFSEAMYAVYQYDPQILINVLHLEASDVLWDLSPEMISEINGYARQALNTMASIFQEGIDAGVVEPFPAVALADLIWSIFTGLVLWEEGKRLFDPNKRFLYPTLKLGIDLLARGMARTPAALS